MLFEKLVEKSKNLWVDYIEHEFADLLVSGEMKEEKFKHYLQQDYLYLIAYRNAFEHLEKNADTLEEREYFKDNSIGDLEKEMAISFDIDVDNIRISKPTKMYIDYIYECLATKTPLEKLICLAPCAIGYGMLGMYIGTQPKIKNNPFQTWIDTYTSSEYIEAINKYIELINKYEVSEGEVERLSVIFNKVCELEIEFFNQALSVPKPSVVTIAGSDSSGGAGVQADIKSISANGGYAASVITAITAQNTCGVRKIVELENEIIESQIKAVFDDLSVKAVKIGMLGSRRIIDIVSKNIKDRNNIVLDPVMVAKDKTILLHNDAINDIVKKLFPLALLVTPNIDEAEQILGRKIGDEDEMEQACLDIIKLGAKNVLIKGGHLTSDNLVDVLYFEGSIYKFYQKRINTIHTHGTGCSLSSAIATNIAKGQKMNIAVCNAIHYVYDGILFNYEVGKGKSPINHFNDNGGHYEK